MEVVKTTPDRLARAIAVAAALLGIAAAVFYAKSGLTLAHFDAKGHLVVARRIVDSLTPGWVQIGALWLPLPHLVNLLPTQVDFFYRTGAFAVSVSVACFVLASWAIARMLRQATGSAVAAGLGVLAFLLNPNVLYLQATPMTEPMLWALVCASLALLGPALDQGAPGALRAAGLVMAGAVLTRYEAWFACGSALTLGAAALLWRSTPLMEVLRRVRRVAVFPAAAILGFLLLSRATVGEWFVSSGFFVPDPATLGQPVAAAAAISKGLTELTSEPLTWLGFAGLAAGLGFAVARRERGMTALPVAVLAMGLLPWLAFYNGHVYRVRYMTALVPAVAIGGGLLVGHCRGRWRWLAAALLLLAVWDGPRPFNAAAPMPTEAQWDRELRLGRAHVTAYLTRAWNGTPIMASMGSLAHYMHELSDSGFRIRDFLHEGNGDIWLEALVYPVPIAEWILIEESARGGDMLAALVRRRPSFLSGYDRVAEGGGVALYRRRPVSGAN